MDTIYLAGSEDVRSAANTMREAAKPMEMAASSYAFTLEQQQRFMNDWLQRFEAAMASQGKTTV